MIQVALHRQFHAIRRFRRTCSPWIFISSRLNARLVTGLLLVSLSWPLLACGPGRLTSSADAPAAADIIENKGSDTLVNLALAWAEAYAELQPEVRISVTGGGSGTGIAAMINGTVDIANASRAMKPEEIAAAQANGINPVEIVVARDAIAVVVHPSNPVDSLTLQQVSDIYTRRITNWSQVGGEDRPIVLLSRESNSGTLRLLPGKRDPPGG